MNRKTNMDGKMSLSNGGHSQASTSHNQAPHQSHDSTEKDPLDNSEVLRAKPAREIYKPPGLRKCRTYAVHLDNNETRKGVTGYMDGFRRVVYYQSLQLDELYKEHGKIEIDPKDYSSSVLKANAEDCTLAKRHHRGLGQSPALKSDTSMFAQFQRHCRELELQNQTSKQSLCESTNTEMALRNGENTRVRFEKDLTRELEGLKIKASRQDRSPVLAIRPVRSKSIIYNHQATDFEALSPPFNFKLWEAFHSSGKPSGRLTRSKSFGSPTVSLPRFNLSIDDCQLSRWPGDVAEAVRTAINGSGKIPARQGIELVTQIFGAVVKDHGAPLPLSASQVGQQFVVPAVNIFMYLIEKDADDTVLESIYNNALVTHQSLLIGSKVESQSERTSDANNLASLIHSSCHATFLLLLTTFCQKVKMTLKRRRSMAGFHRRILSLLCDTSLAVLRQDTAIWTVELAEILFTTMTSLGPEIEAKFPLKMKQILVAVRDMLLGVSPASQEQPTTQVQKTLMQLIELHAANWILPASAVRYYYTNCYTNL